MAYTFEPGKLYRMPTHFGPAPGPRQLPEELRGDPRQSPKRLSISASFLTDRDKLESHVPPRFRVGLEPVVTVDVHYLTDIDWLAGRGYAMIQVSWPVIYSGRDGEVSGRLLAVMWENLAEPIVTGRDEIGHPKLFADIIEPQTSGARMSYAASAFGFSFLDVEVTELEECAVSRARGGGTLMLKYVPRVGDWGAHELCQVTLTPPDDPYRTELSRQTGYSRVRFRQARWADLPTMAHVVNALAALPVLEQRAGTVVRSVGGKDYRDQQIIG